MQLPGHDEQGPILEVFQYLHAEESDVPAPNKHGCSHISFEVDDVRATADAVLAAGGSRLGEIVDFDTPSGKVLRYVYLRDPEGNIIELERTLPGT